MSDFVVVAWIQKERCLACSRGAEIPLENVIVVGGLSIYHSYLIIDLCTRQPTQTARKENLPI
jgi:hypothetical protein